MNSASFTLTSLCNSADLPVHPASQMDGRNDSRITQFILLGLTDHMQLQVPLFFSFLVIYMFTVLGNLGMIILIWTHFQLHTPMYFFLSNLSVIDLCSSTVLAPRMLGSFFAQSKTISYSLCLSQTFSFAVFVTTEVFLLTAMAYDRYVAICSPLLYSTVMTKRVCMQLVVGSYIGGLLNSLTHTCGLLELPFCGPNVINHYFCDIPPLLQLACSDTHRNETLLLAFSAVIALFTLFVITASYALILSVILKIQSDDGRKKTFHTCASHLTAITIFFGSLIFSYTQPSSTYSTEQEKVSAVFYTLLVPMLNPLIYSLRNKEVRSSFRRTFRVRELFH
ncbi:olfactory receptor 1052-like [Numida meleagris]|uniref:olfactory receptor 1052-like n=1 Tax=Numida meleagris TaxID=8996 RepID=UPI000B3E1551|nr:olfactory receptor 1052-like [Numida meleagris]